LRRIMCVFRKFGWRLILRKTSGL